MARRPPSTTHPTRTTMTRTQRLSLLAAIMGSFVVGLDSTVVNVALPAIEQDLGGSSSTARRGAGSSRSTSRS